MKTSNLDSSKFVIMKLIFLEGTKETEMKMVFNKLRHNHSLLMILCCAVPLVAILALSCFNVFGIINLKVDP